MRAIGEPPVGVVLAGGQGRRIGGDKAAVSLAGRPLLSYALDSMVLATGRAVVVAKPSTVLPALGAVTVWEEPEEPSHPLAGIAEALRRADGRSVLVLAGDMPFVPAALLTQLRRASSASAPATIACTAGGGLEPLLGCYRPSVLDALSAAASAAAPARAAVAALGPLLVAVRDPQALFNVNTPEDLERAEQLLAARR